MFKFIRYYQTAFQINFINLHFSISVLFWPYHQVVINFKLYECIIPMHSFVTFEKMTVNLDISL